MRISWFLSMKRRSGKAGTVLIVALVLAIPAFFTFTYYYSLSEADFLSTQLKLEPRDQTELLPGIQEKSKALGAVHFGHLLFLDSDLSGHLPVAFYQTSFTSLTIPVLRC